MEITRIRSILQSIIGKRLTSAETACDMLMLTFEDIALHAQCLARIIKDDDILLTTLDYQAWDGERCENNDERYSLEKFKSEIVGNVVKETAMSPQRDLTIQLTGGILIQIFISNGYSHFGSEREQWRFIDKQTGCHVVANGKSTDILE